MQMGKKYCCIAAMLICCYISVMAQSAPGDPASLTEARPLVDTPSVNSGRRLFVVGDIYIEGNRITRPYIIERELPFRTGDSVSLPDLVKSFDIARSQLMNTALFNEAVVALKAFRGYEVDISIKVKERWYIFPLPYLKPIDRNLTEWAKQGYSLDRINYGFKLDYANVTGRNDKLRLWLITGYTRQLQFQYDQPYADRSLKNGYKIGFTYSFNHEVDYQTLNDQQHFVDSLRDGIKYWNGFIEYDYRPGLRTFHSLRLSYNGYQVDTTLLTLSPKYFGEKSYRVYYPELIYNLDYFDVDYRIFPLKGWLANLSFSKRGISREMNMWTLSGKLVDNWKLAKKLYFQWQGNFAIKLPFDQPFINQRLFGYGDFYLRGLEKYVIDGVVGGLARHSLRRELVKFSVPTYIKSTSHDRIPFAIYARVFGDMGYAYNKTFRDNRLVNTLLYSGGAGVDIVTFYDIVFRIDYSFNQLGQKGLFLHIKGDF